MSQNPWVNLPLQPLSRQEFQRLHLNTPPETRVKEEYARVFARRYNDRRMVHESENPFDRPADHAHQATIIRQEMLNRLQACGQWVDRAEVKRYFREALAREVSRYAALRQAQSQDYANRVLTRPATHLPTGPNRGGDQFTQMLSGGDSTIASRATS